MADSLWRYVGVWSCGRVSQHRRVGLEATLALAARDEERDADAIGVWSLTAHPGLPLSVLLVDRFHHTSFILFYNKTGVEHQIWLLNDRTVLD